MAAGDIARKYLELIDSLQEDDVIERLEALRNLPFDEPEKIYNEAVNDYLNAVLNGEW